MIEWITNADWWELFRQLSIIISTGFGGGAAYFIVDFVKNKLAWDGLRVTIVAALVSVILALSGMVAADEIGITDLVLENLSNVAIDVMLASQIIYFTLKKRFGL